MPKLTTLLVAAIAAAQERGYLLIATRTPITLLRHDPGRDKSDELGSVLADVCAMEEMRDRPTADGHDQGPLRRVLWRRRDVLYDLAPNVQCRRCTKRYGVDPCGYLAWHSHRPKRLQVFTNRTLTCGFRDDRLSRR